VLASIVLLAGCTGGAELDDLQVEVPVAPMPFAAEGADHLVYELLIRNGSAETATLESVTARHEDGPLLSLDGDALRAATRSRDGLTLAPGAEARIFLWLTVHRLPSVLQHALGVRVDGSTLELTGPTIEPDTTALPVLGPPVRGGRWWTGNGPASDSGHRRAAIPVDDRAPIAQRFAIDYTRVASGVSFFGDPRDNGSYFAYGIEVLAVADGRVVRAVDGVEENVPGELPPRDQVTRETAGGNTVVLDLGAGLYASYAHLRPGSVLVEVGDQVRRGEVIGRIGNSGNSTEPHLHFHVSDSPEPLLGEGRPYLIEAFDSAVPVSPGNGTTLEYRSRRRELPLGDRVVRFRAQIRPR